MNNEIEALNRYNTWTVCDLPMGRKAVGSKWLWKIKYKSTGEIDRYKARVVAKGFSQRKGFDYLETFSHVVKMSIVRCVLNVAICNGWDLFQLDISNAFLYGDLSEDVYMTLPPGFNNDKSKVCNSDNVFIILLMYVDDIVVTGNNLNETEKFKQFLKFNFQIKDLGKLNYFLGIEVLDNEDGICLSQRKYCLELLHEFGLLAAKHFMHSPFNSHLDAALRVLRYLKGSPGSGIQINKIGNLKLRAYDDSDWARSSAETEYRSVASATCEVIWLSNVLGDMGVKNLLPFVMYYDNSSALQIAANSVFHEKSKHFEIDVYLVRELGAKLSVPEDPTTREALMIRLKFLHFRFIQKCHAPIVGIIGELFLRSEMIEVTNEKVAVAREKLKEAQTHQKSYANRHRRVLEFQPGEHVFLKVSPTRGVRRFGIKGKLSLDWYQSPGYRELGRFQNLDYNCFSKLRVFHRLSDIRVRTP
ncbi:putative RNA-directed DNA polymerase [Tanacetum coccineum]